MSVKPFLPEDVPVARRLLEERQRKSFFRAVTALALAVRDKKDPAAFLRRAWPGDRSAEMLLRAAVAPITTTDFPQVESVHALALLAPRSAAARLFERGMQLSLAGISRVRVPNVATVPQAAWVEEGAPAPHLQATLGESFLGPMRKILILASLTSELERASPENASAAIGSLLSAAASKLLDVTVFGSGAGDPAMPPGLLYGVTPIAAATTGTPTEKMAADLGNLAGAMAAANVDPEDSILVAAVQQAVVLRLLGSQDLTVFGSVGLPAGTVVMIASAAIASASDGVPVIEAGVGSAVVAMSDNPSGPVVGAPDVTSYFQQDMIGIKCRCPAAWVSSTPGAIQVVNGANW